MTTAAVINSCKRRSTAITSDPSSKFEPEELSECLLEEEHGVNGEESAPPKSEMKNEGSNLGIASDDCELLLQMHVVHDDEMMEEEEETPAHVMHRLLASMGESLMLRHAILESVWLSGVDMPEENWAELALTQLTCFDVNNALHIVDSSKLELPLISAVRAIIDAMCDATDVRGRMGFGSRRGGFVGVQGFGTLRVDGWSDKNKANYNANNRAFDEVSMSNVVCFKKASDLSVEVNKLGHFLRHLRTAPKFAGYKPLEICVRVLIERVERLQLEQLARSRCSIAALIEALGMVDIISQNKRLDALEKALGDVEWCGGGEIFIKGGGARKLEFGDHCHYELF